MSTNKALAPKNDDDKTTSDLASMFAMMGGERYTLTTSQTQGSAEPVQTTQPSANPSTTLVHSFALKRNLGTSKEARSKEVKAKRRKAFFENSLSKEKVSELSLRLSFVCIDTFETRVLPPG